MVSRETAAKAAAFIRPYPIATKHSTLSSVANRGREGETLGLPGESKLPIRNELPRGREGVAGSFSDWLRGPWKRKDLQVRRRVL